MSVDLQNALAENRAQINELRGQLDAAKAANNAVVFKGLAVEHAATLAERRKLLREQDGSPWKFRNQANQFQQVLAHRGELPQDVNGAQGINYDEFKASYLLANPGATGKKTQAEWRKFKRVNNLPSSLTACAKLPASLCDNNPNCEYAIGMKRQYCRKVGKKSRRRRSSKRKSRSRRKGCSGAREANCNSRKNCSWKKGKGCRRSKRRSPRRRRSRSPRRRRSRSPRRKCKRGVKKTSPRKGSCRRKPGRKSRRRRSR